MQVEQFSIHVMQHFKIAWWPTSTLTREEFQQTDSTDLGIFIFKCCYLYVTICYRHFPHHYHLSGHFFTEYLQRMFMKYQVEKLY